MKNNIYSFIIGFLFCLCMANNINMKNEEVKVLNRSSYELSIVYNKDINTITIIDEDTDFIIAKK